MVVVAMVLFSYQVSAANNGVNNDIGWSISNGWLYLHQGLHAKLTDSWLAPHGYHMSNAEWLSDILFYLIKIHFGWIGLTIFVKSLVFISLSLVFVKFRKSQHPIYFMLSLVVMVLFVSVFFVERAEVFSFAFFTLYLCLRHKKNWIWIFLMPLWASLHGGFMIFYPLFLFDKIKEKQYMTLLVVPLSMMLIVLIMPFHVYNLIYPFIGLFSHYTKAVVEFQPVSFSTMLTMTSWLLLGAIIVFIWKKLDWRHHILIVALLMASLHIVRNEIYLAIYVLSVIPTTMDEHSRLPFYKDLPSVKLIAIPFFFVLFFAFIFYPTKNPFQLVDKKAITVLMEKRLIHQKGYLPMQYSDYLSSIGQPIYIDGQGDVWSGVDKNGEKDLVDPFFMVEDGKKPITALPGYQDMTYLLIRNHTAITYQVELMKRWKPIYHDYQVTIYVRVTY
jgi:hypothetical protein